MSRITETLTQSRQITEWIDPHDPRLVAATGEPAPNSGGDLRAEWIVDDFDEQEIVATEVRRLIIPDERLLRGMARCVFANDAHGHEGEIGIGNVVMMFNQANDWHRLFPINRTFVVERRGLKAWAAIALCDRALGLAVFSSELPAGDIQVRIQRVPDDKLVKILG